MHSSACLHGKGSCWQPTSASWACPKSLCSHHQRSLCRSAHPFSFLKTFQQSNGVAACAGLSIALDTDLLDSESDPGSASRDVGEVPKIQWYPGHIAKAERRLKEQLAMVDVVLEVRDARIPLATCHKSIPEWCGTKPRVLVLNRADMIPESAQKAWNAYYRRTKQTVFWTNGVTGTGVHQVTKAASQLSAEINAKRKTRGLTGRPVRACVIGFPNIGKSALINRILKKRACDSAPKPGVTRSLKWIRVKGDLDLLDAPGVIPMSFNDQRAAQLLAICNDIGEASYLESQVAAALLHILRTLPNSEDVIPIITDRWKVDWLPAMTSEDYLHSFAGERFQGDIEQAAVRILNDYRSGLLGRLCLELPGQLS